MSPAICIRMIGIAIASLAETLAYCKMRRREARDLYELRFVCALRRTGTGPVGQRALGALALADFILDSFVMFFIRRVLGQRDRIGPIASKIGKDAEDILKRVDECGASRFILTTMHSRLFYFDLLLLFVGLSRRGADLSVVAYDNFLKKMIGASGLFVKDGYHCYKIEDGTKAKYALRGDIRIFFIDEMDSLSMISLCRRFRGETSSSKKEAIFIASDIAIGQNTASNGMEPIDFLNIKVTPKRGIDFFQRILHCPVLYFRLGGHIWARRVKELIVFEFREGGRDLLSKLYAIFERRIRRHPADWGNWASLISLQGSAVEGARPAGMDPIVFVRQLKDKGGKRRKVAVTRLGRLLFSEDR